MFILAKTEIQVVPKVVVPTILRDCGPFSLPARTFLPQVCLPHDRNLKKKIQLSGPEFMYEHFPLLGVAHAALFRGKYGVRGERAYPDEDLPVDLDFRRQVSSKRQERLVEKGTALRERCETLRQAFFSDEKNKKQTDKRTWSGKNVGTGRTGRYKNAIPNALPNGFSKRAMVWS